MLPMIGAVEAWLQIIASLPFPVLAFINIVYFTFVLLFVLRMLLSL